MRLPIGKIVLTAILVMPNLALSQASMQCERYASDPIIDTTGGPFTAEELKERLQKQQWTIFNLDLNPDLPTVLYTHISGPELFLPSESEMEAIWISSDRLHVVTKWLPADIDEDVDLTSPVVIMDIDFKRSRFNIQSFGGPTDFSESLNDPWRRECFRLN